MIIMGIDLGTVRTGIALCDKDNILAYPFCLIESSDMDIVAKRVVDIIKENKVEKIVIGNPKNMDGTLGQSARNIKHFEKILTNHIDIDIILWDERLTTISAQKNFASLNIKSRKYRKNIDEASATIILQSYIDFYRKNLCTK